MVGNPAMYRPTHLVSQWYLALLAGKNFFALADGHWAIRCTHQAIMHVSLLNLLLSYVFLEAKIVQKCVGGRKNRPGPR